jgi:5,10-methylene-tetrahydrofolate dehydrogenase/methenyl tetrahydrofolate cyclohydrolase
MKLKAAESVSRQLPGIDLDRDAQEKELERVVNLLNKRR